MTPRDLRVPQASEEYSVPMRTLQRWIADGLVKVEKRGRENWINRASLLARIANRPKPGPKRKKETK